MGPIAAGWCRYRRYATRRQQTTTKKKSTAAKSLREPNVILIHESAKHLLIPPVSAAENETMA